jgi:hypothetical protein
MVSRIGRKLEEGGAERLVGKFPKVPAEQSLPFKTL